MPEFQWKIREHAVTLLELTEEGILQNFQMPDFSAQTQLYSTL
jgi:hypothetical protein